METIRAVILLVITYKYTRYTQFIFCIQSACVLRVTGISFKAEVVGWEVLLSLETTVVVVAFRLHVKG